MITIDVVRAQDAHRRELAQAFFGARAVRRLRVRRRRAGLTAVATGRRLRAA